MHVCGWVFIDLLQEHAHPDAVLQAGDLAGTAPAQPNLLTSSGVFHAVIDLIDAVSSGADKHVRMLVCAAATNIVFHR